MYKRWLMKTYACSFSSVGVLCSVLFFSFLFDSDSIQFEKCVLYELFPFQIQKDMYIKYNICNCCKNAVVWLVSFFFSRSASFNFVVYFILFAVLLPRTIFDSRELLAFCKTKHIITKAKEEEKRTACQRWRFDDFIRALFLVHLLIFFCFCFLFSCKLIGVYCFYRWLAHFKSGILCGRWDSCFIHLLVVFSLCFLYYINDLLVISFANPNCIIFWIVLWALGQFCQCSWCCCCCFFPLFCW